MRLTHDFTVSTIFSGGPLQLDNGQMPSTLAYDAVSNRSLLINPGAGRFTNSYDAADQIGHLVNPQGGRTTYTYDAGARRIRKELPDGAEHSHVALGHADRELTVRFDPRDPLPVRDLVFGFKEKLANGDCMVESNFQGLLAEPVLFVEPYRKGGKVKNSSVRTTRS